MTESDPSRAIKVLVVDDHPVVRDGLRLFLTVTPGMCCAGEASNGEQAVQLCAEVEPDVVLMDVIMPGMDGVTATRLICERFPRTRVIALSSFDDRVFIQQMIQAGAVGYLLKNSSMEMLAEAVRAAHAGKSTLSPEQVRLHAAAPQAAPGVDLTEREQEILELMAQGLTNSAIARQLVISEATSRFHVSNILAKLGASNRTEAVRMAIKRGLID